MKVEISKDELTSAVGVARSAGGQTAIPILQNILISGEGGSLRIVASNQDIVTSSLKKATVERAGGIAIPTAFLSGVVDSIRGDISLDVTGEKVAIRSGKSKFTVTGISADQYPQPPEFNGDAASFEAPAKLLSGMIEQALVAVSHEVGRVAITGCLWIGRAGVLEIVSTDGRRLTVSQAKILPDGVSFKAIIPSKSLFEAARIFSGADGNVEVSIDSNKASYRLGDDTMHARLIAGEFPDYEKIIPTEFGVDIQLDAKELFFLMKRASLCAISQGGSVTWRIGDGRVRVTSSSPQMEFEDEVEVKYPGEPLTLALNPHYVIDGVKNLTGTVSVKIASPASPVLFEQPGYKYLVMPMVVS